MFKLIWRVLWIGIFGVFALSIYQGYQKGYFNVPEMPPGAYAFSMASGFRGIVLDASVEMEISSDMPRYFRRIVFANPKRHYLSLEATVPQWMATAWSTCTSPTDVEKDEILANLADDAKLYVTGTRFEAICRVDLDGQPMLRGLLFSAPRL